LHRLVRRNFQRRRTAVSGVDDQWQAHLTDLPNAKMFNDGHTFMLIVIEKFSLLLKNKTGKSILKAFEKILNRNGLKTLFFVNGPWSRVRQQAFSKFTFFNGTKSRNKIFHH